MMALELGPNEKRAALERIAADLAELQHLAGEIGEDFLAFLIAQARDEAEAKVAQAGAP